MATKLRYTTVDTEYTAVFRGAQCNSVVLQQMPEGTPADILLFHGSPDILLKTRPVDMEKESIARSCIETKNNETSSYTPNSVIPLQQPSISGDNSSSRINKPANVTAKISHKNPIVLYSCLELI